MRIGLLGGTFDPVHFGHLWIAEVARTELELDRVIWIPAGDPPHKDAFVAPQEHRYAMVVLATAAHSCFEVSRLELEREGPSYSLYTIQHFRAQFPGSELFFVAGADTVLELLTWHRHEEVIRACRFIAVTRPGRELDRTEAVLPREYLDRIHFVEVPGVDVSSTLIRERVSRGETVRYLVPETVEAYLRKHGLYPGQERSG